MFLLLSPCSVRKTCTFSVFLSTPSLSPTNFSPGPRPLGIPRQDCKGEAAICRWEPVKDPSDGAGRQCRLTHLFRYQEVIAKGLSGAGSAQQEDEYEVQKPPAKTPRVEQSLHPQCAPSPCQPTSLSPWVGRKRQRPVMKPPSLSEGTSSTTSPLAYLLPKNVSLFCLSYFKERDALRVLGVGSRRPPASRWPGLRQG